MQYARQPISGHVAAVQHNNVPFGGCYHNSSTNPSLVQSRSVTPVRAHGSMVGVVSKPVSSHSSLPLGYSLLPPERVRQAPLQRAPSVELANKACCGEDVNLSIGLKGTSCQIEEKNTDIAKLQQLSGLNTIPVSEGLRALQEAASNAALHREQFLSIYEDLLRSRGSAIPSKDVQNAIFDLFDKDKNHVVDILELVSGISLMCDGTEDEKIKAVFDVFDDNKDGYISIDEMFKFLSSVFRIGLTPQMLNLINSMGTSIHSAEDLAAVTTMECFKAADLSCDGRLSIDEFKCWFFDPQHDPSFFFNPIQMMHLDVLHNETPYTSS